MKTYRWFFLVLVTGMMVSCKGTSEEELIGDWQRRAFFRDTPRSHAATFVIGNKGYVCCGWSTQKQRRNDVFEFDHRGGAGKGSWKEMNIFPGPRRSHAVGFSIGGFGYIGTGYGFDSDNEDIDMKDFWRYDPDNDEWTEVAPMPEKARTRRGAIAFSLFVGGKEYGYVGFGLHDGPLDRLPLMDLWQFDPEGQTTGEDGEIYSGHWTEVEGYGGYKREGAAVFVIDNKAYICNGKTSSTVNDFWLFDPNAANSDDVWKSNPPRPMYDANPDEDYDDDYGGLGRSYGVAYVASVSGQLRGHIVGGEKSSNWEYDHDNDLWIQRTQFYNYRSPNSRDGMVSFSFPNTGRAFAGMGRSGITPADDMWEFIPLKEDFIYDD